MSSKQKWESSRNGSLCSHPQEVLPITLQANRPIPLTHFHGFSITDLVVAVNGVWILVETFMLKGELQLGPSLLCTEPLADRNRHVCHLSVF